MLEAIGLTKTYRSLFSKPVQVLRGLTFTAPNGAVTGLIGGNGSGKTTTFRICAGLLPSESGTVRVDGHDVRTAANEVREVLSLLPEARGLRPELRCRQVLQQIGMLRGLSGFALSTRIGALAERLHMEGFIDRKASNLSRGQAAKISLGRALIADTQNLILDEPTTGLDVIASEAIRALIVELRGRNRCIILSTHQIDDILGLCDQIAILHEGVILSSGPPMRLAEAAGYSDFRSYLLSVFQGDKADAV